MVILTKYISGLGNMLLLTSHFVANAAAYGYELRVPAFEPYFDFFEGTAGRGRGAPPPPGLRLNLAPPTWPNQLLYRALRPYRGLLSVLRHMPAVQRAAGWRLIEDDGTFNYDLNDPAFVAEARAGCLLAHGWLYRDRPHFIEHADLVRQLFRPVARHRQAVAQVLADNRAAADVLVGVHIRRGDYATFYDGVYFFSNAGYARFMGQVRALLPAGARVRFLLCSNETIPAADFAGFDTGRGTGHFIEDLYALAGCDYLIGPLSTYSTWASFYGKVPICPLHHAGQVIAALDEFEVFADQSDPRWHPAGTTPVAAAAAG